MPPPASSRLSPVAQSGEGEGSARGRCQDHSLDGGQRGRTGQADRRSPAGLHASRASFLSHCRPWKATRNRSGELVLAQLFGDRLHLARRNTLHVHFGQRRNQCFLTPLVPLEHFRSEAALPVLRNPQVQFPHTRHQRPALIARAVPESVPGALSCRHPAPLPSPFPVPAALHPGISTISKSSCPAKTSFSPALFAVSLHRVIGVPFSPASRERF